MKKLAVIISACLLSLALQGCSSTVLRNFTYTDTGVNKPGDFPVLRATGYAILSRQPGPTTTDREIQAMRASKLEAYRELSEQLNGVYVKTHTGLSNTRERNDSIYTEVEGFVHGARVIRQYPLGNTYVTELELDTRAVYDMYDMRGVL
ncbi:MAG: LPP20 family lipoprotein [Succinivibrio sp.]|nr:LPP20 family lipoprotein [Succinivibrio sp.]